MTTTYYVVRDADTGRRLAARKSPLAAEERALELEAEGRRLILELVETRRRPMARPVNAVRLRGRYGLTPAQIASLEALARLAPGEYAGARDGAGEGSTLAALERRGLADVTTTRRPYRRVVARLTPLGRRELGLDGNGARR